MKIFHALALAVGIGLLSANAALATSISFQSGAATSSETCDSFDHSPGTSIDGVTVGGNGWATASNCGPGDTSVGETAVWETTADFNATELEFILAQNFGTQHLLGRFRLSVTSDDRSEFDDGLANGGDVTANWTVLANPVATGPASLGFSALSDESVLVSVISGIPQTGTYIVKYTGNFIGITGIRLETIEDSSLPFNGPGLQTAFNDNFVLTELRLNATGTPNVIPVPAAFPLLLTGLAGLGFLGWRKRTSG